MEWYNIRKSIQLSVEEKLARGSEEVQNSGLMKRRNDKKKKSSKDEMDKHWEKER